MNEHVASVYYATSDYVSLWRRFAIDCIDGALLSGTWFFAVILTYMFAPEKHAGKTFMIAAAASAFLYLVVLKYVGRTLGYWLLDARVVNLQGNCPSILSLAIRSLFVFVGPGTMFIDITWLTADSNRQTIRDKMARTYVIRSRATPLGKGHVRYVRLDMMGMQLILPEVTRNTPHSSPMPEAQKA